jgi:hypothetical protein
MAFRSRFNLTTNTLLILAILAKKTWILASFLDFFAYTWKDIAKTYIYSIIFFVVGYTTF